MKEMLSCNGSNTSTAIETNENREFLLYISNLKIIKKIINMLEISEPGNHGSYDDATK